MLLPGSVSEEVLPGEKKILEGGKGDVNLGGGAQNNVGEASAAPRIKKSRKKTKVFVHRGVMGVEKIPGGCWRAVKRNPR